MPSFSDLDPVMLGEIVELAVGEAADAAKRPWPRTTDRWQLAAAMSRTSLAFLEPCRRLMFRDIIYERPSMLQPNPARSFRPIDPSKLLAFLSTHETVATSIRTLTCRVPRTLPERDAPALRGLASLLERTVQSLTYARAGFRELGEACKTRADLKWKLLSM